MEKNKLHQVKAGKGTRMSFSNQQEVLEMPNLMDIQKKSYEWFLREGLQEIFDDISPITANGYSVTFNSAVLDKDDIKYDIEKCKARKATYEAPLKVETTIVQDSTEEVIKDLVYMGKLPLMTPSGSFVYNGAERVIVSQLVRSPGIYFDIDHDKYGTPIYTNQVIPNRGAWLECESDANGILYIRIDKAHKIPITTFIRALGVETDSDEAILDMFGDDPMIRASFAKDTTHNYDAAMKVVSEKIKPGDPPAERLVDLLFNTRRYDLTKVGRYKFNKKLALSRRIAGHVSAETIKDPDTGKAIVKKNGVITREIAEKIQNIGVPYVDIICDEYETFVPAPKAEDAKGTTSKKSKSKKEQEAGERVSHNVVRVLSNRMVDMREYVGFDPADVGIKERVSYDALMELIEQFPTDKKLKEALKYPKYKISEDKLNKDDSKPQKISRSRIDDLIPKHITKEDIFAFISYIIGLSHGIGQIDDIDHLGNRRIRAVGELLQDQYRKGFSRLEKNIIEKLNSADTTAKEDGKDTSSITVKSIINCKAVTSCIKEFFGSSQLSQFMDQNNPLAELTHKRRLSALGPGGLTRERAGFEVRDVHYTHYGRMCPIETPEGPNIGLINSLATYARINEYGFIEAPYRKVDKSDAKNPRVTDEVEYLTADAEDEFHVAQANSQLDEKGHFVKKNVSGRYRDETSLFPREQIDYMDVSPKMVFSVATSMIPFLQNDDANRALMGSNMQRQAVPLMLTETAFVGTGMEEKAAKDSGVCIVAEHSGTVEKVSADSITIKLPKGGTDTYTVSKFKRSNQSNCYNQRPIVNKGDKVKAGDIIADGASSKDGEIGLGKNPLIGFMTWEGYNYEDAVLISERLVKDDVYTSIHIEQFECECRSSKLGDEDITRDIPGVGEDARKNLGEDGIVYVGAEVRANDILVGRVAPKGETELTPEERLLRAIFGERARDVKDASLTVPHGAYGTVIATEVFTKDNADLSPGVLKKVVVYVAQKRKISVGDKMAGRHGNKGVVSRVLPVEDMPFLPNGRPLDIVLNPLGVPSRMNIGQVLETHLSLACAALGFKVTTPVFDGANESDIMDALEMANDYVNGEWKDFQKKYKSVLGKDILDYLEANLDHRELWKGVELSRDGKVQLRDGRTGENFDGRVTIGHMHYLKLHHLVDDKIHARSTGPYSLITSQPLGGKAQFGGQRFGEMEVWALEAYGAAYTLQEILTVKSDDVIGRVKTYEAIIKGKNIPTPSVPESFKVLLRELQSLALDITLLDENDNEVEVKESAYTEASRDLRDAIEGSDRSTSRDKEKALKSAGFQTQGFDASGSLVEDEPSDIEEEN